MSESEHSVFAGFDARERAQFIADLHDLLSLTPSSLTRVLERWSELIAPQEPQLFVLRVGDLPESAEQVESAIHCLDFLLQSALDPGASERVAHWARDLVRLGFIDDAELDRAEQVIEELVRAAPRVLRRLEAESGVMPSLRHVGTTVEVRAVQQTVFELGDDLGSYRPEVDSLIPIVSLYLAADAGESRTFHVQMTAHQLHLLVEKLKATLADVAALERRLNGA